MFYRAGWFDSRCNFPGRPAGTFIPDGALLVQHKHLNLEFPGQERQVKRQSLKYGIHTCGTLTLLYRK
jgi:hypothetical protein